MLYLFSYDKDNEHPGGVFFFFSSLLRDVMFFLWISAVDHASLVMMTTPDEVFVFQFKSPKAFL